MKTSTQTYIEATHCRICNNSNFEEIVDLGMQCLQGSFVKIEDDSLDNIKIPTKLVRCKDGEDGCSLVQLSISVPQSILYSNYWYESGVNNTMRNHLKSIVENALENCDLKEKRVLDIGCNDGTLLRNYNTNIDLWGVDPSDIAVEKCKGINLVSDVFPSDTADTKIGDLKFDIVTSIAMYYDLPDPVGFAKSVYNKLTNGGIWIVEMSYLPLMLEMNSFDTICHEHVEYYKLADLELIGKRAGFKIKDCSLNYINGGSIRIIFQKSDATVQSENYLKLKEVEHKLALNKSSVYTDFKSRVEALRASTMTLINDIVSKGETIHIYGASTKGNVLLQYYGLNSSHIVCAAERNLNKVGYKTLGSDIPIVSEADSRALNPDYYLVLPWHFGGEFLAREKEAIMKGTKMIFPLPELLVIDENNFESLQYSMEKPLDKFTRKYNL